MLHCCLVHQLHIHIHITDQPSAHYGLFITVANASVPTNKSCSESFTFINSKQKMRKITSHALHCTYLIPQIAKQSFLFAILEAWLWGWQCLSVGPPLWSRLKYLNSYVMDCNEIWFRHLWSPKDEA